MFFDDLERDRNRRTASFDQSRETRPSRPSFDFGSGSIMTGTRSEEEREVIREQSSLAQQRIQEDTINVLGHSLSRRDVERMDGGDKLLKFREINSVEAGRKRGFAESLFAPPSAKDVPFVGFSLGSDFSRSQMQRMATAATELAEGKEVDPEDAVLLSLWHEMDAYRGNATKMGMIGEGIRGLGVYGMEVLIASKAMAKIFGTAGAAFTAPAGGAGAVPSAVGGAVAGAVAKTAHLTGAGLWKLFTTQGLRAAIAASKPAAWAQTHNVAKYLGTLGGHAKTALAHGVDRGIFSVAANTALNVGMGDNPLASRQGYDNLIMARLSGADMSENAAHTYALADRLIEIGGEATGEMLGYGFGAPMAKYIKRPLQAKGILPTYTQAFNWGTSIEKYLGKHGAKKTKEELAKLTAREKTKAVIAGGIANTMEKWNLTPGAAIEKLQTMGYDGFVNEMMEERASDFMRGLFGVNDFDARFSPINAIKNAWISLDELAIEAAVLATPMLGVAGMQKARMINKGGARYPYLVDKLTGYASQPGSRAEVYTLDGAPVLLPGHSEVSLGEYTEALIELAEMQRSFGELSTPTAKAVDFLLGIGESIASVSLAPMQARYSDRLVTSLTGVPTIKSINTLRGVYMDAAVAADPDITTEQAEAQAMGQVRQILADVLAVGLPVDMNVLETVGAEEGMAPEAVLKLLDEAVADGTVRVLKDGNHAIYSVAEDLMSERQKTMQSGMYSALSKVLRLTQAGGVTTVDLSRIGGSRETLSAWGQLLEGSSTSVEDVKTALADPKGLRARALLAQIRNLLPGYLPTDLTDEALTARLTELLAVAELTNTMQGEIWTTKQNVGEPADPLMVSVVRDPDTKKVVRVDPLTKQNAASALAARVNATLKANPDADVAELLKGNNMVASGQNNNRNIRIAPAMMLVDNDIIRIGMVYGQAYGWAGAADVDVSRLPGGNSKNPYSENELSAMRKSIDESQLGPNIKHRTMRIIEKDKDGRDVTKFESRYTVGAGATLLPDGTLLVSATANRGNLIEDLVEQGVLRRARAVWEADSRLPILSTAQLEYIKNVSRFLLDAIDEKSNKKITPNEAREILSWFDFGEDSVEWNSNPKFQSRALVEAVSHLMKSVFLGGHRSTLLDPSVLSRFAQDLAQLPGAEAFLADTLAFMKQSADGPGYSSEDLSRFSVLTNGEEARNAAKQVMEWVVGARTNVPGYTVAKANEARNAANRRLIPEQQVSGSITKEQLLSEETTHKLSRGVTQVNERYVSPDGTPRARVHDALSANDATNVDFGDRVTQGDAAAKAGNVIHDLAAQAIEAKDTSKIRELGGVKLAELLDGLIADGAVAERIASHGGLAGRIDILVVDKATGGLRLLDFKTTRRMPSGGLEAWLTESLPGTSYGAGVRNRAFTFSMQLSAYAFMVENALGVPVTQTAVIPVLLTEDGTRINEEGFAPGLVPAARFDRRRVLGPATALTSGIFFEVFGDYLRGATPPSGPSVAEQGAQLANVDAYRAEGQQAGRDNWSDDAAESRRIEIESSAGHDAALAFLQGYSSQLVGEPTPPVDIDAGAEVEVDPDDIPFSLDELNAERAAVDIITPESDAKVDEGADVPPPPNDKLSGNAALIDIMRRNPQTVETLLDMARLIGLDAGGIRFSRTASQDPLWQQSALRRFAELANAEPSDFLRLYSKHMRAVSEDSPAALELKRSMDERHASELQRAHRSIGREVMMRRSARAFAENDAATAKLLHSGKFSNTFPAELRAELDTEFYKLLQQVRDRHAEERRELADEIQSSVLDSMNHIDPEMADALFEEQENVRRGDSSYDGDVRMMELQNADHVRLFRSLLLPVFQTEPMVTRWAEDIYRKWNARGDFPLSKQRDLSDKWSWDSLSEFFNTIYREAAAGEAGTSREEGYVAAALSLMGRVNRAYPLNVIRTTMSSVTTQPAVLLATENNKPGHPGNVSSSRVRSSTKADPSMVNQVAVKMTSKLRTANDLNTTRNLLSALADSETVQELFVNYHPDSKQRIENAERKVPAETVHTLRALLDSLVGDNDPLVERIMKLHPGAERADYSMNSDVRLEIRDLLERAFKLFKVAPAPAGRDGVGAVNTRAWQSKLDAIPTDNVIRMSHIKSEFIQPMLESHKVTENSSIEWQPSGLVNLMNLLYQRGYGSPFTYKPGSLNRISLTSPASALSDLLARADGSLAVPVVRLVGSEHKEAIRTNIDGVADLDVLDEVSKTDGELRWKDMEAMMDAILKNDHELESKVFDTHAMFVFEQGNSKDSLYGALIPRSVLPLDHAKTGLNQAVFDAMSHHFYEAVYGVRADYAQAAAAGLAKAVSSSDNAKRQALLTTAGAPFLANLEGGVGEYATVFVVDPEGAAAGSEPFNGFSYPTNRFTRQMLTSLQRTPEALEFLIKGHWVDKGTILKVLAGAFDSNLERSTDPYVDAMRAAAQESGFDMVVDGGGVKLANAEADGNLTPTGSESITMRMADGTETVLRGHSFRVRTSAFRETSSLDHDNKGDMRAEPSPLFTDASAWIPSGNEVRNVIRDTILELAGINTVAGMPSEAAMLESMSFGNYLYGIKALDFGVHPGFPSISGVVTPLQAAWVANKLAIRGTGVYVALTPSGGVILADGVTADWSMRGGKANEYLSDIYEYKDAQGNSMTGEARIEANARDHGTRYETRLVEGVDEATFVRAVERLFDLEQRLARAEIEHQTESSEESEAALTEAASRYGKYRRRVRDALVSTYDNAAMKDWEALNEIETAFTDLVDWRTGKLRDGVIIRPGDTRHTGGSGTIISGSLNRMDRTPGGGPHAHVPVRLSRPASLTWEGAIGRSNIMRAHPMVIHRGGTDFDGDMYNVRGLTRSTGQRAALMLARDADDLGFTRQNFARRTGRMPAGTEHAGLVNGLKDIYTAGAANRVLMSLLDSYQSTDFSTMSEGLDVGFADSQISVTVGGARMLLSDFLEQSGPNDPADIDRVKHDLADTGRRFDEGRGVLPSRAAIVADYRTYASVGKALRANTGVLDTENAQGQPVMDLGSGFLVPLKPGTWNKQDSDAAVNTMRWVYNNIVNLLIDDVTRPRARVLGLDATMLPVFNTIMTMADLRPAEGASQHSKFFEVFQGYVDWLASPAGQVYRAASERVADRTLNVFQADPDSGELRRPGADIQWKSAVVSANNSLGSLLDDAGVAALMEMSANMERLREVIQSLTSISREHQIALKTMYQFRSRQRGLELLRALIDPPMSKDIQDKLASGELKPPPFELDIDLHPDIRGMFKAVSGYMRLYQETVHNKDTLRADSTLLVDALIAAEEERLARPLYQKEVERISQASTTLALLEAASRLIPADYIGDLAYHLKEQEQDLAQGRRENARPGYSPPVMMLLGKLTHSLANQLKAAALNPEHPASRNAFLRDVLSLQTDSVTKRMLFRATKSPTQMNSEELRGAIGGFGRLGVPGGVFAEGITLNVGSLYREVGSEGRQPSGGAAKVFIPGHLIQPMLVLGHVLEHSDDVATGKSMPYLFALAPDMALELSKQYTSVVRMMNEEDASGEVKSMRDYWSASLSRLYKQPVTGHKFIAGAANVAPYAWYRNMLGPDGLVPTSKMLRGAWLRRPDPIASEAAYRGLILQPDAMRGIPTSLVGVDLDTAERLVSVRNTPVRLTSQTDVGGVSLVQPYHIDSTGNITLSLPMLRSFYLNGVIPGVAVTEGPPIRGRFDSFEQFLAYTVEFAAELRAALSEHRSVGTAETAARKAALANLGWVSDADISQGPVFQQVVKEGQLVLRSAPHVWDITKGIGEFNHTPVAPSLDRNVPNPTILLTTANDIYAPKGVVAEQAAALERFKKNHLEEDGWKNLIRSVPVSMDPGADSSIFLSALDTAIKEAVGVFEAQGNDVAPSLSVIALNQHLASDPATAPIRRRVAMHLQAKFDMLSGNAALQIEHARTSRGLAHSAAIATVPQAMVRANYKNITPDLVVARDIREAWHRVRDARGRSLDEMIMGASTQADVEDAIRLATSQLTPYWARVGVETAGRMRNWARTNLPDPGGVVADLRRAVLPDNAVEHEAVDPGGILRNAAAERAPVPQVSVAEQLDLFGNASLMDIDSLARMNPISAMGGAATLQDSLRSYGSEADALIFKANSGLIRLAAYHGLTQQGIVKLTKRESYIGPDGKRLEAPLLLEELHSGKGGLNVVGRITEANDVSMQRIYDIAGVQLAWHMLGEGSDANIDRVPVLTGLTVDTLQYLDRVLPKSIADRITKSADSARKEAAMQGNVTEEDIKSFVVDKLVELGWAVQSGEPGNIRGHAISVPAGVIAGAFETSNVKKMLVEAGGRDPKRLKLGSFAKEIVQLIQQMESDVRGFDSTMYSGDSTLSRFRSHLAPEIFGHGYMGPYEQALLRDMEKDAPVKPDAERVASYKKALGSGYDALGNPRPLNQASETLLGYLMDLIGEPRSSKDAIINKIRTGEYVGMGLKRDMTYVDLVEEVNVRTIERTLQGTKEVERLRALGFDAWAMREAVRQMWAKDEEIHGHRIRKWRKTFRSAADAFREVGKLPRAAGAGETLQQMANDVFRHAGNRMVMNRAVLTTTSDGHPTVVINPRENFQGEGVITEETLSQHLTLLAKWSGYKIDNSKTVRENLRSLVDGPFLKNKSYELVSSPYESVSSFYAYHQRESGGEHWLDATQGGEVAGLLKHITESGWKPTWAAIRGLQRVNNWQKMLSVQMSVFFPEALMESLTSMSEGKAFTDLSKDLVAALSGKESGEFTMLGFYHMLRSGHPFAVDFVQSMIRNGYTLSASQNPSGVPVGYTQRDMANIVKNTERHLGPNAAKAVRAIFAVPQAQQKLVFDVLHSTGKVYLTYTLMEQARKEAERMGKTFSQDAFLRTHANIIDNALGGDNINNISYMTPKMQAFLNATMFSAPWTRAAWRIGGGDLLAGPLFKQYVAPHEVPLLMRNWAHMAVWVMVAMPQVVQGVAYMLGKALGGGDDEDKFFMFQNEPGKRLHADLTPLARTFLYPWYDRNEKRRIYARWGKQVYEVISWLDSPVKSLQGKSSTVLRSAYAQMFGKELGGDWPTDFQNVDFLRSFTSGETKGFAGSRLAHVVRGFTPFSIQAAMQDPAKAPAVFFGPVSRGASYSRISKDMVKVLREFANDASYLEMSRNPRIRGAMESGLVHLYRQAERNGIDYKHALSSARGAVLKELYAQMQRAKTDKERYLIANRIHRLNGTAYSTLTSYKAVQRIRNRELDPDTMEAMREAMKHTGGIYGDKGYQEPKFVPEEE